MSITHRRICWPKFDTVCLEGGCGYCNGYPFRSVATIERRLSNAEPDMQRAHVYGKCHRFCNAETKEAQS